VQETKLKLSKQVVTKPPKDGKVTALVQVVSKNLRKIKTKIFQDQRLILDWKNQSQQKRSSKSMNMHGVTILVLILLRKNWILLT
jgi:hypothetical protein